MPIFKKAENYENLEALEACLKWCNDEELVRSYVEQTIEKLSIPATSHSHDYLQSTKQ